jgi:hypothetical protein
MRGTVSFHPVEIGFFEEVVEPIVGGGRVNPDEFVERATRLRLSSWVSARYLRVLEWMTASAVPPPLPSDRGMVERARAWLDRFDFRPDPRDALVRRVIEPDLHLHGRPFFVAEGSAEGVASVVDEYLDAATPSKVESIVLEQLVRLHPKLGRAVAPEDDAAPSSGLPYRAELLRPFQAIFDMARAARAGEDWGPPGRRRPAIETIAEEMPWRAVWLHSRVMPHWIGRDVDGLATVCRAAGIEPPACLTSAAPLFAGSCESFPSLVTSLASELDEDHRLGAYVAPDDVPHLAAFLNAQGSRIIQAATRAGEGPRCVTLLRKIRECLAYAERHGHGYLEAAGIHPVAREIEEQAA